MRLGVAGEQRNALAKEAGRMIRATYRDSSTVLERPGELSCCFDFIDSRKISIAKFCKDIERPGPCDLWDELNCAKHLFNNKPRFKSQAGLFSF